MKKYCENCEKKTETQIVEKRETYEVHGEPIEINAKVLICTECGEDLYCEKLDNDTLNNAYNEYRRKHKLLFPAEIKKIREQYGLSQRSFSELLHWGDKTIFRYENGSIQDCVHNSLLLFLRNPENMKKYLTENEITLDQRKKEKLNKYLNEIGSDISEHSQGGCFTLPFCDEPCAENGFRAFDYDKLCSMVIFFANQNKELLKTKLMKLLNYSDMIFYKENSVSISGMKYVHLPYGPVPDKFDILLGTMEMDHIVHVEIVCDNGYEKHQIVADAKMKEGILSKNELEVMERVQKKFNDFGSVDISKYSHKEKGYRATQQGDIISYVYAKDISLN